MSSVQQLNQTFNLLPNQSISQSKPFSSFLENSEKWANQIQSQLANGNQSAKLLFDIKIIKFEDSLPVEKKMIQLFKQQLQSNAVNLEFCYISGELKLENNKNCFTLLHKLHNKISTFLNNSCSFGLTFDINSPQQNVTKSISIIRPFNIHSDSLEKRLKIFANKIGRGDIVETRTLLKQEQKSYDLGIFYRMEGNETYDGTSITNKVTRFETEVWTNP